MPDTRLIERWLPIAEIGEEATRERRSMTALPPTYYLHVWWARRPLVASRAAILASLLPADADRNRFLHVIGIHGDPVATRRKIDAARRRGERFEGQAYSYPRAFGHVPGRDDEQWLQSTLGRAPATFAVLDPTAGGGSIPFEALRLGTRTVANDLNPVSALLMRATAEWPFLYGSALESAFGDLSERFVSAREERLAPYFPPESQSSALTTNWLWARTVTCPYCDGLVPLSPNWRLASDGTGVRLLPDCAGGPGTPGRVCAFEIVGSVADQFPGTVARGDGHCPYADCGRVVDGAEIKRQAQAGRMGEQLYAVVYKQRVETRTKSGKRGRDKWVRGYRAPRPEDDNAAGIAARLAEKLPEWEAFDLVPSERFPEDGNDDRPIQYGMPLWRDLFSPRQLLCHGVNVEVYREMLDADRSAGRLDELRSAAYGYLALSLDKLLNYNSRMSVWMPTREVVANTFNRHDFAFCWSHAEMAPLVTGLGYDWAMGQTAKCIRELVALVRPKSGDGAGLSGLFDPPADGAPTPGKQPAAGREWERDGGAGPHGGADGVGGGGSRAPSAARAGGSEPDRPAARADFPHGASAESADPAAAPPVAVTCKSGDDLDHLADGSVDAVVMDPPYYDNVMYAELSDFFYVWLKRTAGHVFPELFRRRLTDKDAEAVANPARFAGQAGARELAGRDYQERMAAIFAECRRVLKPDGIMTLMFTHKATGAWDALTTGLIEAGFVITASWPVNTEAEGSLHIKDKAAANSTIFLVCRPRAAGAGGGDAGDRRSALRGAQAAPAVREDRPAYGDGEAAEAPAVYWEDVEPGVARAVRARVEEFQAAGIAGVDLYLASFGPALEEFSRHWPLRRGTPRPEPAKRRRQQRLLFDESWDPYAVTPEDALDAARREVKRWVLGRLTRLKADDDLDPPTAFFVLAWHAFKAPVFAFDEALRLARAVGVDLEDGVVGRAAGKKGSNLHLWDSARRAAAGALGPADGSGGMIDALHHAAHAARGRSLAAAAELVAAAGLDREPRFFTALEAVLEVLPPSKAFTGVALEGAVEASASDFEALYNLYRFAYGDRIDEPDQLHLWRADGA